MNEKPDNMDADNMEDSRDLPDEPADGERTLNFSFALTRFDLLWYNLHSVRWVVLGAIVLVLLLIIGFIWIINIPSGDMRTAMIWIEIGLAAGFSVCIGTTAAIVLQIFFIKNETVARAMTPRNYTISADSVAVFTDKGRIERTWRQVQKIIRTRAGFYIQTGDKVAIVIPRRVLESSHDLQAFEEILKRHKRQ